jgi:hypothetical protein
MAFCDLTGCFMPKTTFMPEQILPKLRQIEVLIGQVKTMPLGCKSVAALVAFFRALSQASINETREVHQFQFMLERAISTKRSQEVAELTQSPTVEVSGDPQYAWDWLGSHLSDFGV